MNFFDVVFQQPIVNLFYGIFVITRDVGVATVMMSLIIRLIMWPYIKKSYITGQKTRMVQPIIRQIQKAYKGNIMAQQEALKKLYQKYDIKASLSGLIILLQLPIYFALFNLIRDFPNSTRLNGLYEFIFGKEQLTLNKYAFGFLDITYQLDGNNYLSNGSIAVLTLSILTLIFTFLMSKYIFPTPIQTNSASKNDTEKSQTNSNQPESIIDAEVFNKTLQFQMTYFMPVVSFMINLNFPAGLNIYFLAGTVFSFIQQYRLAKKYRVDVIPIEFDEEIVPKHLLKEENTAKNKSEVLPSKETVTANFTPSKSGKSSTKSDKNSNPNTKKKIKK